MSTRLTVTTAANPGAVAIIQIVGSDVVEPLQQLTGRSQWSPGLLYLTDFTFIEQSKREIIDTGLACMLRDDWAQLMPHGGPRVLQKIIDALVAAGVSPGASVDALAKPRDLFPEANSDLEADMLAVIAHAASPAAVDLLLAQPHAWQHWLSQGESARPDPADIIDRSDRLDRLVHAPSVVVVGQPNVGKSTLTNRMLGRSASIVADLPGTTRDWVGGLAELTAGSNSPLTQGIAVRWLDTPGLRTSDDAIEQAAITLANDVIEQADVLIALRDSEIDWPDVSSLPRTPDLWAMNKIDRAAAPGHVSDSPAPAAPEGATPRFPLLISAETGQGVARLQACVIQSLGLGDLSPILPWAFSPSLRRHLLAGDELAVSRYMGNA